MNRMIRVLFTMAALILAVMAPAVAQDAKPGRDEVKALALKAAALIADQGIEQARRIFHDEGEFKHGEIYVNVVDMAGTWLVYPPRPAAEGQSVINAKDPDNRFVVQEILKIAKDTGEGWVEYRWLNPVSNRIEPKITFVKRVPDRDLVTYVGVYK